MYYYYYRIIVVHGKPSGVPKTVFLFRQTPRAWNRRMCDKVLKMQKKCQYIIVIKYNNILFFICYSKKLFIVNPTHKNPYSCVGGFSIFCIAYRVSKLFSTLLVVVYSIPILVLTNMNKRFIAYNRYITILYNIITMYTRAAFICASFWFLLIWVMESLYVWLYYVLFCITL